MIPAKTIVAGAEQENPSRTFRLGMEAGRVTGCVDGLEAVRQAVYLMLGVERYQHLIYGWDYGVELADLFGQPPALVLPELKRRITEALLQDKRVVSVGDFTFEVQGRKVSSRFGIETIYGTLDAGKEMEI